MPQPSFLSASLMVLLGGGLGSWLRFVVGRAWTAALGPVVADTFPYGTLTVNLVGSTLMGALAGCLVHHASGSQPESARLLLGVGALGGFTTFSSFSLDVVALAERGQPGLAAGYAAVSLLAGFGGLFLGLSAMRSIPA